MLERPRQRLLFGLRECTGDGRFGARLRRDCVLRLLSGSSWTFPECDSKSESCFDSALLDWFLVESRHMFLHSGGASENRILLRGLGFSLMSWHSGLGDFLDKPNSGFGGFLGVEPLENDFEKWHSFMPFLAHSTQTLFSFPDMTHLLQFDNQQLSHILFLMNVPSAFVWNNLNFWVEPSLSTISPSRMELVS